MAIGALGTPLIALGAVAPAGGVDLRGERNNGDYLNRVKVPTAEKTLREALFDSDTSRELSQRYQAMQDAYEHRRNHGLNGREEQYRYHDANRSIVNWTLSKMLDDKLRTPVRRWAWRSVRDKLRGKPEQAKHGHERGHADLHGTIGSAQEASARIENIQEEEASGFSFFKAYRAVEYFYNNGLMLDDTMLMRFQYDVPSGVMNLSFMGDIINANFEYYTIPLAFGSGGMSSGTTNPDQLALSLSKDLKELGLSTGVNYKIGTRALNYGVNKHLTGPLSAAVSQARYADASRNETTCRLNLGMSF